ncbi:MAG: hypothetical protein C0597_02830 [Marinilabiliales bacterium]|nr:MAG: hypothetical protein C0597_02830 [Marinilabiliales bacterium]
MIDSKIRGVVYNLESFRFNLFKRNIENPIKLYCMPIGYLVNSIKQMGGKNQIKEKNIFVNLLLNKLEKPTYPRIRRM